ncbi:MrpH family fimbial adhesin [Citrobacter farmeri]|uniref:MrpH family fimbial adhesin n=1 Tax=Citrobacter farmeri TaxID=67824 RepID=UPI002930C8F2|nr:hypothetical protein [Citrobacter farmeri]
MLSINRLLILLTVIAHSAMAVPYNWPVVVHADIAVNGIYPGTSLPAYSGTIYWRSVLMDDDWGDDTIGMMLSPGVGFIYRDTNNIYRPFDYGPFILCATSQPKKECLDLFETTYGTSGSFYIDSAAFSSNLCLTFSLSSRIMDAGTGTTLNVPPGQGGSCFKVVDPDEYCTVTSDNIVFDYGVIHTREVADVRAEAKVSVECNSNNTKFSLRTGIPNDEINLSNGLKASINLNGSPVSTQVIYGVAGIQSITLDSRLKGTPVQTGVFNGSGILYIFYE